MSGVLDGIILLDKPAGGSSHGAVAHLRRILRTRSLGHGGTLDPSATGLLLVLAGRATHLAGYLGGGRKVYEATFRFGCSTTTDDAAGEKLEEAAVPQLGLAEMNASKKDFIGEIEQVPPDYSAVWSDGKRAYRRARSGQSLELNARKVMIESIEIRDWQPPDLRVVITCGSGTYVRSLARDWGRRLHSAAHVSSLRRVKSGVFDIEECLSFEEVEQHAAAGEWDCIVRPPGPALERAVGCTRVVDGEDLRRFVNGAEIADAGTGEQPVVVVSPQRELLGIGKAHAGFFRAVLVYPST